MTTKSRALPRRDRPLGAAPARRLIGSLTVVLCCTVLAPARIASAAASAPEFSAPQPGPELLTHAAAFGYSNLSPSTCTALVKKRALPYERVYSGAQGIETPLRLTGAVHGVKFTVPGKKSRFGLLDCRLLLALDDLAALLSQYQVAEVRVDSFYRPKAHLQGRRKKLSQHAFGLAMDLVGFKLKDGSELNIERDFAGTLGQPVCGTKARLSDDAPKSRTLRNLVCAIARSGIFNNTLTPNFNAAHHNHVHLDITQGAHYVEVK